MKPVEMMSFSELKYQAKKIDWGKIPIYNHPDWVNDSLNVIRSKMIKVMIELNKEEKEKGNK